MHFNRENLKDGMILRVEGSSALSRMIKAVLYGDAKQSYFKRIVAVFRKPPESDEFRATHDAIIFRYKNVWVAGDALAGQRARCTPLTEYEAKVNAGKCKVKVAEPLEYAPQDGRKAADWWYLQIRGTIYDYRGILNLGIKWIFPAWRIRHFQWAWWCTEGLQKAWECGAGLRLWMKRHSTPFTTQKRTDGPGFISFRDISDIAITY
ncbi:MAG: hypothetical protein ACYST6_10235 [Planctomycetota bacterium]|jgi:hypothetical protein